MIRDFSEEKKEEIFRILDEIDMKDWKPFMEWCGSSVEEFGNWPEKLGISAYTRYVDEYHQKILDLNEMTRQQVNTVFENVAEIDARYAKRMRECQEKIKEQIAMVRTMSEFMQSMTDGNPNIALLSGGNVSKAVDRTESTQKDRKEIEHHHNGMEEQQPEVIVLDIPETGVQVRSIIVEAEAQGIIGEPEVAFMSQLMHYIRESETISFGRLDGLEALYNNGLVSEENYNCLLDIKEQTNGLGNYNIFDLKEQARNVYTEIEKVIAERTAEKVIMEGYVNEEFLSEKLGWELDKINPLLGVNYIEDMRTLMLEYGLTDEKSIIFFLMTISIECQNGQYMLERRGEDEFEGLSYTYNTRGAGLIQLTGPDQKAFLEYILERTEDEAEQEILNNYIEGFVNCEKPDASHPCDCTVTEPNIVADYIAENYPIESALWYWCVQNKASIDGEDLSLNECIETYGDSADPFMMYIGVQCAVNGSEFKPRGIGRFFRYWNWIEISDDMYWQKITTENGKVIYKPHEEGSITLYYSDTDNGEDGDKEHVQSYKPYGLSDRIAIYESVMGPVNETQP